MIVEISRYETAWYALRVAYNSYCIVHGGAKAAVGRGEWVLMLAHLTCTFRIVGGGSRSIPPSPSVPPSPRAGHAISDLDNLGFLLWDPHINQEIQICLGMQAQNKNTTSNSINIYQRSGCA